MVRNKLIIKIRIRVITVQPSQQTKHAQNINRNNSKRCEVSSKLTIKTPEWRQWHRSVVFNVNYCWFRTVKCLFVIRGVAVLENLNLLGVNMAPPTRIFLRSVTILPTCYSTYSTILLVMWLPILFYRKCLLGAVYVRTGTE